INIFSISVLIVNADDGLLPDKESVPGAACNSSNCGNYSLNDMVSVALKISTFILSIVGSLALLAFVAGGLMMMLSAGNPEWVTRGKQTLIGAVIGLTIVFTSYMIIYFVYQSLDITQPLKGSSWFTSDWFINKTKK
ncbi:pilin, partial [Patescibacteria group bacterium]|nr:pilin [Patescibacteria group bacterium]